MLGRGRSCCKTLAYSVENPISNVVLKDLNKAQMATPLRPRSSLEQIQSLPHKGPAWGEEAAAVVRSGLLQADCTPHLMQGSGSVLEDE